ncbi:hypothetical protein GJAV_G00165840, partial [Gymnothorax javanicus]
QLHCQTAGGGGADSRRGEGLQGRTITWSACSHAKFSRNSAADLTAEPWGFDVNRPRRESRLRRTDCHRIRILPGPTKCYIDLEPEPAPPKRQRQSHTVTAAVALQPPVPPPPMDLPPSGHNSLTPSHLPPLSQPPPASLLSPGSHLPPASHPSPAAFPPPVRRSLSAGVCLKLANGG